MQFDNPLDWIPDLKSVIEYSPLIVTPETPLLDAIAMISQAHYPSCSIDELDITDHTDVTFSANQLPQLGVRNSCVLVKQNQDLVGILTARDVVRITAQEIDFGKAKVADFMTSPVITMPQRSIEDIFAALFLFRRYQIRHLPLVDENEELIGVISHESIRHILRPANLLRFRRVADVMTTEVIHAPLEAPVLQLAQLMAEYRVSCVVITQPDDEDNQRPVGIVTERDIVQFHAFQIDLATTQAQEVMSTPLFLLSPEDSLWTAHQEMKRRMVGRMVVSWNWGKELGIVTQTSLLRIFDPMEMYGVIENMQQTIQEINPVNSVDQDLTKIKSKSEVELLRDQDLIGSKNVQDAILLGIRTKINYLLEHLDLSKEDLRSHLQSILNNLDSLG
ncbi:CBS domain-containing protein [Pseudanabaena sp. ABRG5-3]|uniref:CBS domain-containing protein n=1 Tax=Pseudanabaena sp. ABRG5-3 TaxID=685565 RepID=UPI000DC6E152|nr:CBS domain-containing protein [Pseudanabaena sp. ABRG5-3]BBC24560.1 multi-sensor hybrid histidine kinase [Pseudanabaena sp. ABRG5-3]